MPRYLVHLFSRAEWRERHITLSDKSPEQAKVYAARTQGSELSDVKSVTDIGELTVVEVPERHPRKNWKCYKIKEWPTYKADLDITDPGNSIMISCFDPTEYCKEDQDIFEHIILKKIQNEEH